MSKPVEKFLLTVKSNNKKTGPMAVSTSPMDTCPSACPFKENGCYSNYGPIKIWWKKCSDVEEETLTAYLSFLDRVRALPKGEYFRHNQGGDLLPFSPTRLAMGPAYDLVEAASHVRGFSYTHFPMLWDDYKFYPDESPIPSSLDIGINRETVETMNANGFTVNISCNSIDHADRIIDSNLKAPVTTVLPKSYETQDKAIMTPAGNRLVVCPAMTRGKTCTECGLCMWANRRAIVGFPAHGTGKKRAEDVFNDWASK